MAARDELLSKLLKTPSMSPTLEETLDFINRNAPKWGADAHRLGREGLNKQFMVKIGDKAYNLAPDASRWVQMPDGKIVAWPKGDKALKDLEKVKGAKLLNFSPEKIESLLPPAPKPPAPEIPPPSAQSQTAGRLAATEERMAAEAETAAQREAVEARMAAERQAEIDRANAWKNAGADEARRIERIMNQQQAAPAAASEVPPVVQLAKDAAARVSPPASGRPRGPWDAPPPPPTSVPSARPAPYDPLKEKFPLSTELSLYAAPPAALAYGAYMTPSPEERLQKRLLAAVQAGQPSEDINPSESDIDAALKIARERALEAAYSREGQNSMLGAQNASRAIDSDLEPGYTTPGAAAQWSDVDMRPQPVARPASSSQPSIPADGTIAGQQFGTGRYAAQAERPSARPSSSSTARPSSTAPATSSPVSSGFSLGNLLGKIYDPNYQKDMSSRQLFEAAQREPENPVAFFRADKRWREENPNYQPPSDDNRKRGGAVGGTNGKDAALHKALDIIHSMMMRGRH
jgi:hypothetical protein